MVRMLQMVQFRLISLETYSIDSITKKIVYAIEFPKLMQTMGQIIAWGQKLIDVAEMKS